jgi:uncharacterized protein
MRYMTTFSGKLFNPEEPDLNQIDILDISVALSRIPRFVGHTTVSYSVAQHCMLVCDLAKQVGQDSELYTKRIKLLALLHDADEAYISDIPSPVKQMLKPDIITVENRIMSAIYSKLNIQTPTATEKWRIKKYDNQAFDIENRALRGTAFNSLENPFNPQEIYSISNEIDSVSSIQPYDPNLIALIFMRKLKNLME